MGAKFSYRGVSASKGTRSLIHKSLRLVTVGHRLEFVPGGGLVLPDGGCSPMPPSGLTPSLLDGVSILPEDSR